MRRAAAVVLGLMMLAVAWRGPAAAPLDEATALYRRGDFLAAAVRARAVDGGEGLTLAARALLAHAAYQATPEVRSREVADAESLARAAMAADPVNAQAVRLLVVALGYRAREVAPLTALFRGYVGESRSLLERAHALEPDSGWLDAVRGGWHAEIVRTAGPVLAESLFGATTAAARANFARAMERLPDDPVVRFECGRAMLALEDPALDGIGVQALEDALGLPARDAFEDLVQDRARRLLAAVRAGDRAAARQIMETDRWR